MSEKKRFRSGLWGFKKSDVISYIQQILKEFTQVIAQKDGELEVLKEKVELLKFADSDKSKIAEVLIKAHDILEDAKNSAEEEKKKQEEFINTCKREILMLGRDMECLQEHFKIIFSIVQKYNDNEQLSISGFAKRDQQLKIGV